MNYNSCEVRNVQYRCQYPATDIKNTEFKNGKPRRNRPESDSKKEPRFRHIGEIK